MTINVDTAIDLAIDLVFVIPSGYYFGEDDHSLALNSNMIDTPLQCLVLVNNHGDPSGSYNACECSSAHAIRAYDR